MNTTNETSKLTSLATTMAPTTTFSKSTKKGLAVLAALCMLSFYTGHLSRGGEQLSNVSLLRNGVLESGGVTTTNGISDIGGVTTSNGQDLAPLNLRLVADDEGNAPPQCRPRNEDCTRFKGTPTFDFCRTLRFCRGCMKDSDCVEGSCVITATDLLRPASTHTMCVIPEECRATTGRPTDLAYTTCDGVDAWTPTGSTYHDYNKDCCGNKECVTVPKPYEYSQDPEYNYCGDVCIKRKNCDQNSAHTREAQCGDGDYFACCSESVRERNWKDKNGDTCQRRTGQGGRCDPGTLERPNCDCAPVGGQCRGNCYQWELLRCEPNPDPLLFAFPICPDTCCVGGSKCDSFFEKNNIYTQ